MPLKNNFHNNNHYDHSDHHSDWKQIEVFIDGPYGAPAVDIFETEHAVLIAAGIGSYVWFFVLFSNWNESDFDHHN